jgi:hypothetical protein
MQTVNVYVATDSGAVSLEQFKQVKPSIRLQLGTVLAFRVAFLAFGNVPTALPDGEALSMVVKGRGDHAGDALGLDIVADTTGTGSDRRYTVQAMIDGDDARALLDGKEEAEVVLQLSWGTPGDDDHGKSDPLSLTLVNAYNRGNEAAPSPLNNAADAWLMGKVSAIRAALTGLTMEQTTGLVAALGLKADLVGGKIPTDQLPAIAINDTFQASTQAAMLALTAQRGDMCWRTDTTRMYVLAAEPASTLANWIVFDVPPNGVISVNGVTGQTIVLTPANFGLGSVPNFPAATQTQAEAGVSATTLMTPQRTLQAMQASTVNKVYRGALELQPHTSAGLPAAAPPDVILDFNATSGTDAALTISHDGSSESFSFGLAPADGFIWIDTAALASADDYANAFAAALTLSGLSAVAVAGEVVLSSAQAGAHVHLSAVVVTGNIGVVGGGSGSDATDPTGGNKTASLSSFPGKQKVLLAAFAQIPSGYGSIRLIADGDQASPYLADGGSVQVGPKLDTDGGRNLRTNGVNTITFAAEMMPVGGDPAILHFTYLVIG